MRTYTTTKDWVSLLRDLPSPGGAFLTVTSLARLTGLRPSAIRQACWRQQRAGLLRRVGPNLYANLLKTPQGERLAAILFAPAYLSLEWALSYHGFTQRATPVLTCVTTGRPRRVETFLGPISYRHVAEPLFFGFERTRTTSGAETFLAYPEKAMLDWIYLRQRKGSEVSLDEINLSGLKHSRLRRFAQHFPPSVQVAVKSAFEQQSPQGRSRVRRLADQPLKSFRGSLRGMPPGRLREKKERFQSSVVNA
jgi:hypothetical protein